MIYHMVQMLAEMIKPAAPTEHAVDLITGNTKNWSHCTYMILQEHYEELLEEVSGLLTPDWKEAFEVAVRWATRNLPRITQEAIEYSDVRSPVQPQQPTKVTVQTQAPQTPTVGCSVLSAQLSKQTWTPLVTRIWYNQNLPKHPERCVSG